MTRFVTSLLLLVSSSLIANETGYHPELGDYANIVTRGSKFPCNFGPTGVTGWFYGREFVVNGLDKGSPADGILKRYDRIRAVNGRRIPSPNFDAGESDSRRVLGQGITEAETEKFGGKLTVTVWRNGKEADLVIQLPVLGSYSKTWPYECQKSDKILDNACNWLSNAQLPEGNFVQYRGDGFALGPALNGLLLLSSGKPAHLEAARRLAYHMAAHPGVNPIGTDETHGTSMWGWSYGAMFIGEYYLRTGDSAIRPYWEFLKETILTAKHVRGSWSHGYKNASYAVGGYINHTGIACLTSLAFMQQAGYEIDKADMEKCKYYFRRYSFGGRGIHYGDHKSPFPHKPRVSLGTGKNGVAVVAFEVLGEQDTSDRFARSVVDSFRARDGSHTGPFLNLMWGPIGASRGTPAEFRMFMDYWTWFHDLSRRWDGSFLLPSQKGGSGFTARGPIFTAGGQALAYALSKRITRICGAKASPFATIDMPMELVPVTKRVDDKAFSMALTKVDELLDGGRLPKPAHKRAALMRDSLRTTMASVHYTLTQIETNLADGQSVLARTRIANLEKLLGAPVSGLTELKAKAAKPRHDKVAEAWKTYIAKNIAAYANVEAYVVMEKLAADSEVGFVQQKAKETLAATKEWPSYKDCFLTESIAKSHYGRWELKKDKDVDAHAVLRYLSFGDGIIWPTWVTRNALEKQGFLGEFPFSTYLLTTSDKGATSWKYFSSDDESLDNDCLKVGFDDSTWKEANMPFIAPPKRKTKKTESQEMEPDGPFTGKYLVMRRTFDSTSTDLDALRIKGQFGDSVDIYLNSHHVARLIVKTGRTVPKSIDFDISSAGLPALKGGRNLLVVKATRQQGYLDVGLLSVKR